MHSSENDSLKPALAKQFERLLIAGFFIAAAIYFIAWFAVNPSYVINAGLYGLSSTALQIIGFSIASPLPCEGYAQHIFAFSLCVLMWLGFAVYAIARMIPCWKKLAEGEMEYARIDRGSSPAKMIISILIFLLIFTLFFKFGMRAVNNHFCDEGSSHWLMQLGSAHSGALFFMLVISMPVFLYALQLILRRKS